MFWSKRIWNTRKSNFWRENSCKYFVIQKHFTRLKIKGKQNVLTGKTRKLCKQQFSWWSTFFFQQYWSSASNATQKISNKKKRGFLEEEKKVTRFQKHSHGLIMYLESRRLKKRSPKKFYKSKKTISRKKSGNWKFWMVRDVYV